MLYYYGIAENTLFENSAGRDRNARKVHGDAFMKKIIISLLFTLTCFFSYAQIIGTNPEFLLLLGNNSLDNDYETQMSRWTSNSEWQGLVERFTRLWDTELNSVYKKIMKTLSEDQQKLLKESQRAWLDHYNREIVFFNTVFGSKDSLGRETYISWLGTMLSKKRDRAIVLLEYYYMLSGTFELEYDKRLDGKIIKGE